MENKLQACFRKSKIQRFYNCQHYEDWPQHHVLMLKLQIWWEPPESGAGDEVSSVEQLCANGAVPHGMSLASLALQGQTTLSPSSGSSHVIPRPGTCRYHRTPVWVSASCVPELGWQCHLTEVGSNWRNTICWQLSFLLCGTSNKMNKHVSSCHQPPAHTHAHTETLQSKVVQGNINHMCHLKLNSYTLHLFLSTFLQPILMKNN